MTAAKAKGKYIGRAPKLTEELINNISLKRSSGMSKIQKSENTAYPKRLLARRLIA
jgi:DNA invertase Pin-like site-specific DNA recombinase